MRLSHVLLASATALTMSLASAQGTGDQYNGWFNGSGPVDHSVSEIGETTVPYQLVELDGNLIEGLDGNLYVFKDASGEIMVNVPDEVFVGQEVTPTTPVKIQGEVHQDVAQPNTVDVYTLDITK